MKRKNLIGRIAVTGRDAGTRGNIQNPACLQLFTTTMFFQIRHLTTGIRRFSRKHGCISMGALEGSSDTNLLEISPRVSTSLPTIFHAFSIPFRRNLDRLLKMSSSLLIQISLPRRNNSVFTSVIYNPVDLISR